MKKLISLCMTLLMVSLWTLPASAAGLTHTVVKGDTMWKLAV